MTLAAVRTGKERNYMNLRKNAEHRENESRKNED